MMNAGNGGWVKEILPYSLLPGSGIKSEASPMHLPEE
jgi:hypothetical protein